MHRVFPFLTALALLGGAASFALACPLCRDAVPESSGAEYEDQMREAAAFNHSIYLMVSMPYLLLGVVGVAIYRAHRQHAPVLPPSSPPPAESGPVPPSDR